MNRLRKDAERIWWSGVAAVHAANLVRDCVEVDGNRLTICDHTIDVAKTERVLVVGAGKACAEMAAGLETALQGSQFDSKLSGWINVPEPCLRPMRKIHLHAARPAGVNEPTMSGVEGTERILDIVQQATEDDVLIVLLSGGGSALLPASVEGMTLADKQQVTRLLMTSGAPIEELNCVRKHLSKVKGGRLLQNCNAGTVISLIISDVIGDSLETIASGPTREDSTTAKDAWDILERHLGEEIPANVKIVLEAKIGKDAVNIAELPRVFHHIVGNNTTAREAAEETADMLGYRVHSLGSQVQGEAKEVGKRIAKLAVSIRTESRPIAAPACIVGGGETTVNLRNVPNPGKGGRNQEFAIALLNEFHEKNVSRICLLAGGTDGEDGPTDAAGAFADETVRENALLKNLDVTDYLNRHDAYRFFEQTEGLFKIGTTHTNVMDLWVAIVSG